MHLHLSILWRHLSSIPQVKTNHMLSSLSHQLCSLPRQPELFELERDRLVGYSTRSLFPLRFMWGSDSCWDLEVMDGFLISPSEHGCITCFDYPASSCSPLKGTSAVELEGVGGGVCRYWIVWANYFNQAHRVCRRVKQMLFNPHL